MLFLSHQQATKPSQRRVLDMLAEASADAALVYLGFDFTLGLISMRKFPPLSIAEILTVIHIFTSANLSWI